MVFTTMSDGNILYAAELNGNFLRGNITSVYTGTGFDASNSTASHTITLTSGQLDNATYLLINFSLFSDLQRTGGDSEFSSTLKVERSVASAATWTDALATQAVHYEKWDSGVVVNTYGGGMVFVPVLITLSAGEKAGGIDIKITGSSNTTLNNKGVIFQIYL